MLRLEIIPTKGEYPIAGNGQGKDFALKAINTKFWHGLLEPHECPQLYCSTNDGSTIKTMHHSKECECRHFDKHLDIAECFCDMIFWTGDGKPKFSTKSGFCFNLHCTLGVPCPTGQPTAGGVSPQQCSSVVYRYVNAFGHVGTPSRPTAGGGSVISGIEMPPPEYCISGVEIFILLSGTRTGLENNLSNSSGYMSAGIYPLEETVSFDISELGLELDSMTYYPPPENLQGMQCHEYGLVGFEGQNIWFTEANIVNAWNGKMCLDIDIKCIEYWNGSLFVFTDEWILRLDLKTTENGYTFTPPFKFGERPFPIIGRPSKGQSGIFFASVMGGVVVNHDTAKVITSKFGKDDWLALCHDCESSYSAITDYGIGIFTKNSSYMFEFGDGSFLEPTGELYQLPFIADYASTDQNGILNYSVKDKWYKWDNCYTCKTASDNCTTLDTCCHYLWESYNKIFDTKERLTAGFIEFEEGTGDINLKILDCGCGDKVIFERTFNESTTQCRSSKCFRKYFRLKGCKINSQIKIILEGCGKVRRVVLGTSRSSLRGK